VAGLKILLSIVLWIPVIVIKLVLVVLGLGIVPISSKTSGLYRAGTGRPVTYWERAVRNPVGGFDYLLKHPDTSKTYGYVLMEPHQMANSFVWRFKVAGVLSSVRMVWKYSKTRYGECYLGWKIDSAPPQLDFALSLRPWATVGN